MRRIVLTLLFLAVLSPILYMASLVYDSKNALKSSDRKTLENAAYLDLSKEEVNPANSNGIGVNQDSLVYTTRKMRLAPQESSRVLQVLYSGFRAGGFYRDWGPTLLKLPLLPTSFRDEVSAVLSQQHFPGDDYLVQYSESLKIRVYYRGFYATVDSKSGPSTGDQYEIPMKLDSGEIEVLEEALRGRGAGSDHHESSLSR